MCSLAKCPFKYIFHFLLGCSFSYYRSLNVLYLLDISSLADIYIFWKHVRFVVILFLRVEVLNVDQVCPHRGMPLAQKSAALAVRARVAHTIQEVSGADLSLVSAFFLLGPLGSPSLVQISS